MSKKQKKEELVEKVGEIKEGERKKQEKAALTAI